MLKVNVVKVFQGDVFVSTRTGEMLATVLGACVASCIRDPVAQVGGMNHFLLPDTGGDTNPALPLSASLRSGSYSMEQLLNGILAADCRRDRLEVKLLGAVNEIGRAACREKVGQDG